MKDYAFRTRFGFCYVYPDRLVFSRGDNVGTVTDKMVGTRSRTLVFILGAAVALLLAAAFYGLYVDMTTLSVLEFVVAAVLIFLIIRLTSVAAQPVIERERIERVEYVDNTLHEPSQFRVVYANDLNSSTTHVIELPETHTSGQEQRAYDLLQRHGYLDIYRERAD